eukprot:356917-Chlamydomonas_euryale.AAC.15
MRQPNAGEAFVGSNSSGGDGGKPFPQAALLWDRVRFQSVDSCSCWCSSRQPRLTQGRLHARRNPKSSFIAAAKNSFTAAAAAANN